VTDVPAHLVAEYTQRGFPHLPPLLASYGERPCGGSVRVYASSAATEEPSLWLRVDEPTDRNDPDSPTTEATVHVSARTARQLRDQLAWLLGEYDDDDEEAT
jgi:hypothetical protein